MAKKQEIETRPQIIKQPKRVEVRVLVPWLIVTVMVVATAGLITGWTLRTDFDNNVRGQVTQMFAELKEKS